MSEMDDERGREAQAGEERAATPPRLASEDAEQHGESFSPSDTTHPYAAITDDLTVTGYVPATPEASLERPTA